jgi:hypothetical protein
MNTIYGDIPQSVLTSDDRIALRRPLHSHSHTPANKMSVAPTLTLESMIHLQHILRLQNPLTPDSKEMPAKQHIILEYFIGAADLHDDAIHFGNAKTITTFLYGVAFTDADVNQTIYYRVCYENTKGVRSVWSATMPKVIA